MDSTDTGVGYMIAHTRARLTNVLFLIGRRGAKLLVRRELARRFGRRQPPLLSWSPYSTHR